MLMRLRKYQIELQQTIDFSNYEHDTSSTSNRSKSIDTPEIYPMSSGTSNDVNLFFLQANRCLLQSKRQIANNLHRDFEKEFSNNYIRRKTYNTLLEPDCKPGLDLIIMLTTRPRGFYERVAIRNGWGRIDSDINKYSFRGISFNYKTIFTIGRDKSANIERIIEDENIRL